MEYSQDADHQDGDHRDQRCKVPGARGEWPLRCSCRGKHRGWRGRLYGRPAAGDSGSRLRSGHGIRVTLRPGPGLVRKASARSGAILAPPVRPVPCRPPRRPSEVSMSWRPRLALTALLVAIAPAAARAQASSSAADTREVLAYRLTMPKLNQLSQAMADVQRQREADPAHQRLQGKKRELAALGEKDELSDAEQERMERLEEEIAAVDEAEDGPTRPISRWRDGPADRSATHASPARSARQPGPPRRPPPCSWRCFRRRWLAGPAGVWAPQGDPQGRQPREREIRTRPTGPRSTR